MPRRLFYVLLPMLSLAGQAIAHPHVFVDADVGFAVNGTRLDSLRIAWTYDEFTTLVLFDILDLDADGDGVLTDDDLAKVVKGETDWPEGYDGDVHLEVGGVPVALTRPTNASAEMRDDRMVVVFDLPLEAPLDLPGDPATLRLYDPSYYYSYTITGITDPAPDAGPCSATLTPFEAGAATASLQRELAALSREQMPEQPDVGRLFAR